MVQRSSESDFVVLEDGRRVSRRSFLALGLGSVAVAALAACTPAATPSAAPTSAPAAAPAAKKAVTKAAPAMATDVSYSTSSMASSVDPRWSLGQSGSQAARQVFDSLALFDDDLKMAPQLATEWRRIDDLTLELKLRDDVKFSNGEDFTAESVRVSLEHLLTSEEGSHRLSIERMGSLVEAKVINSTTVQLITKDPDPILLNRLNSLLMVPPKFVSDGGSLAETPIGTGPYTLAEFEESRFLAYEARDDSWRGTPTIQTARINRIPEAATRISSVKSGDVDFTYNPPGDQVAGLLADGFEVMTINANSLTMCTYVPSNPLMQDIQVREALNLAVNKQELLDTVQAGFGKVATGQLLQPGMFGYNDSLEAYPYDPDRARSMLDKAGAIGAQIRIMTTQSTRPIMSAVVGYLNAVGVKAELEIVEFALLLQAMGKGTDREMLGFNIEYTPTLDFDTAGSRFSSVAAQPQFDNAEFHKLYLDARKELDETKREGQIMRMAELMHGEFAMLSLIWRETPTVFSSQITKLPQRWDTSFRFEELEKLA